MKLKSKAKSMASAAAAQALRREPFMLLFRSGVRMTTAQIAARTGAAERAVTAAIKRLKAEGLLITDFGGAWGIADRPASTGKAEQYASQPDGTYLFGFSSDQHLSSKYERLDVLESLYDRFVEQGIQRVFNAGNWIDGEARFNMHDLSVHGMDEQCHYLAKHFPSRPGIVTYSVAGDDHEGWYGHREGIDIGKHAERIFRESGRDDWRHLGFMESFVELVHCRSRKRSRMLLMHPGGGSAYAHSYKPQKIVEGFAGGEKPSVLLIGHYHKLSFNVIRNVFAIQTGTTQDQTPFMRKKGIDAHVGGGICKLTQDAHTGAIVACRVEFFQYFNRGYYNNRWSHGGKVTLADRGAANRRRLIRIG
jgi:hypothetical protein